MSIKKLTLKVSESQIEDLREMVNREIIFRQKVMAEKLGSTGMRPDAIRSSVNFLELLDSILVGFPPNDFFPTRQQEKVEETYPPIPIPTSTTPF